MKSHTFKAFLLATGLGVMSTMAGCSLMLPERTFLEEMERDQSFYDPGKDFPVVGGDTGEVRRSRDEIMSRTPANARQKRLSAESLSIKQELAEKEERMDEQEKAAYSNDKKFLPTDSDKLYYLSLMGSQRETYISTKKEDLREDMERGRNILEKRSIHSSELYLGMAKSDVVSMWGKPYRVEIAGNPSHQNERWSFIEDGSVKQVYFEGGRVQGWALDL
jgi:hypothetical protein